MTDIEATKPDDKARFDFCPKCGRKGLYHIKEQYQRCRYCGTYLISGAEKSETKSTE